VTIRELFEQLALTGEFELDRQPEAAVVLAAAGHSTPWYIQGLIGISAWIAALCFIGFLAIAGLIDSESSLIVSGVIFTAAAVGLKWGLPRSIFAGQLALALGLAGQVLFIVGIGSQTESVAVAAFAAIGLELVLLVIYRDTFQRLLSTLIIVGAVVVLFFEGDIQEAVHLLILLLAALTLFIWEQEAYLSTTFLAEVYRPVGYGCAVALLALLTPSIVADFEIERWWLSAIGLLALLLVLEYLILIALGVNWRHPAALALLAGTLLLLWPAWQSPGILGALLVLLVGFRGGNRLLTGLAAIFLAVFIIAFYYNLELTLLVKSFMLIGSGVIILALRYVLLRFWQRGEGAV
jgi:hypothetical protein